MKIETKPINEIEHSKEIVITKENKESDIIDKKQNNETKDINILPNDKKEEEKLIPKNESGIIFKKLIKTEDTSSIEAIRLKPRKLKTKLHFARTKLDIANENIKNENNELNNKNEDKKEEIKIETQINI